MDDALLITLIGGGLVFVGLILLWLMMAILVRLTAQKKSAASEESEAIESGETDLECKQKAAVAAVGAAMALMNSSFTLSSHKEKEVLSPWQNTHRNLTLSQSISMNRRKTKQL